jgi:AAA+ superfamily predicted ATPase
LKLLAGAENIQFISSVVCTLNNYEESKWVPTSLLIVGPSRNGKTSLAYEIAKQTHRTYQECISNDVDTLGEFIFEQKAKRDPHVSILNDLHILGRSAIPVLSSSMRVCEKNRSLFIIGLCHEQNESSSLAQLFTHRVQLKKPGLLSRKDILGHYMSEDVLKQELANYIAQKTEGLHSGKLKVLANRLCHVLEEKSISEVDMEIVQEELVHVLKPKEKEKSNMHLYVATATLSAPIFLHLWDWAAKAGFIHDPDQVKLAREKMIALIPNVSDLIRLHRF